MSCPLPKDSFCLSSHAPLHNYRMIKHIQLWTPSLMAAPCPSLEHLFFCATLRSSMSQLAAQTLAAWNGVPVLPADEYQADYISFKPGRPDSSVFRTPEDCKDEPLQSRSRPSSFALQMETLLPSLRLSECRQRRH